MRTLAFVLLTAWLGLTATDDSFMIRGAVVHPVSRPEIQKGSILGRNENMLIEMEKNRLKKAVPPVGPRKPT